MEQMKNIKETLEKIINEYVGQTSGFCDREEDIFEILAKAGFISVDEDGIVVRTI